MPRHQFSADLGVLLTEGHAGTKVLNCMGNHAAEAGDQVGEEANVSPVAPAVVSQVWQLEAPFSLFLSLSLSFSLSRRGRA